MAAQIKQYPTPIQQDATLSVNTALGANNATTSTAGLDLGCEKPFPTNGRFVAQISVGASANAANSKNVNITLQDSNVNTAANFTNIAELAPLVVLANVTALPATTRNVALPPSTRRYVRLLCITENTGGNPNDATATLSLLF